MKIYYVKENKKKLFDKTSMFNNIFFPCGVFFLSVHCKSSHTIR